MNNAPTKELTTPNGHKVVMKQYVTGREFLSIAKEAPASAATATNADNIEKGLKMLALSIVSVDGVSDNVADVVQDLPLEDYMFISEEVAKLANFQKTKTSSGTSSSS
jgi:hypothetical protein